MTTEQALKEIKEIAERLHKETGVSIESVYFNWTNNLNLDKIIIDIESNIRHER